METKICTLCKIDKDISCFRTKKNKGKEILYSWCRECEREYNKKLSNKYYEKNKDKIEKYYQENKNAIQEKRKSYIEENREKARIRSKYLNGASHSSFFILHLRSCVTVG